MNIAIIQARENSNRLPKKVLLPLMDKTVLEHVVNRVSRVELIDQTIVATGCREYNSSIIELGLKNNFKVFSGSDEDVLNRYYEAALSIGAKHGDQILRITADCPLIDPYLIELTLEEHLENNADYSANNLEELLPDGMDVEILSFITLETIHLQASKKADREHVTKFIYDHPNQFHIHKVKSLKQYPLLRLTLDEQEDYDLIAKIYKRLFKKDNFFGLEAIIELHIKEPEIFSLNLKYTRNEGLQLSIRDEAFVKHNLSRMCLGTAQLGLNYGVLNTSGKIKAEEFKAVLLSSQSEGIHLIDTASSYGSSEQELGQIIPESGKFQIITKYKKNTIHSSNEIELPKSQLATSLKSLRKNKVYCYLLHSYEDLKNVDIFDSLKSCKTSGLTEYIGVSVYDKEEAMSVMNYDDIDFIQVKYNIFDNELDEVHFFELAKEKKKQIYVRSIFLQGVLLANDVNLPSHLIELTPHLKELDTIANSFGLLRIDIALYYVLQNQFIDGVIVGFDNIKQFQQILDSIKRLKPNKELSERLSRLSRMINKNNIDPRTWTK